MLLCTVLIHPRRQQVRSSPSFFNVSKSGAKTKMVVRCRRISTGLPAFLDGGPVETNSLTTSCAFWQAIYTDTNLPDFFQGALAAWSPVLSVFIENRSVSSIVSDVTSYLANIFRPSLGVLGASNII